MAKKCLQTHCPLSPEACINTDNHKIDVRGGRMSRVDKTCIQTHNIFGYALPNGCESEEGYAHEMLDEAAQRCRQIETSCRHHVEVHDPFILWVQEARREHDNVPASDMRS